MQNSWAQGVERHQVICLGDISGRFPVGQDFGRQIEFDLEHTVVSGETDTALSVVKTTSFVWKGDAHQRPPSSCQRSPALLFGWELGLAPVDDCFRLARGPRRADLVLTPLPDTGERQDQATRFMWELASDRDSKWPADVKTSVTILEPARSINEAAELEDIPSSFVGARFCTLDDSALKTSRHCYLKSCWNTGLQGEAEAKAQSAGS